MRSASAFASVSVDPAFDREREALARIEVIAWQAYEQSRKAPRTHKAGPGFADPDYDLSDEWRATHERLKAAQQRWSDAETRSRALLICGASRNDGSCPGEMSKTWRLAQIARETIEARRHRGRPARPEPFDVGLRAPHPSLQGLRLDGDAAVPLAVQLLPEPCARPDQRLDGRDLRAWVSAHGVLLVTPVYWYQVGEPAQADDGPPGVRRRRQPGPDHHTRQGAEKAKAIELDGWPYPKHLAGRTYGVVVHGDVAGIEGVRRALCDWLDWMGLIDAGAEGAAGSYIGYYEPYATSHDTLDQDRGVQQEVRNAAQALAQAIGEVRLGTLHQPDRGLKPPRPK